MSEPGAPSPGSQTGRSLFYTRDRYSGPLAQCAQCYLRLESSIVFKALNFKKSGFLAAFLGIDLAKRCHPGAQLISFAAKPIVMQI